MAVDVDEAHRYPDPPGYAIEHVGAGLGVAKLRLIRLADREVVGVFDSRQELDAAVAADPGGPTVPPEVRASGRR